MSQIEDSQSNWENSVRIPNESIESNIKIIGQRYQIVQELDRVGDHRIYLAEDKDIMSSPLCLIKEIAYGESEQGIIANNHTNWQEIVSLQNQLALHPRIPQVLNSFAEESYFYLVLEYLEGESLSQQVTNQCLNENQAIILLQDILEILYFVHDNYIVQGNIQPSNIIKTAIDQRFVIKDFSNILLIQVGDIETQNLNADSRTYNQSSFLAPEYIVGNPIFSSDLYGLGKTAIYALTGSQSTRAQDLTTDVEGKKIHPQLKKILARMSDANVAKRYNSVLEVIKDLNKISTANNLQELTISDLDPTNIGQTLKDTKGNSSAPPGNTNILSKLSPIFKPLLGLVTVIVLLEFFSPFLRPNYYILRGKQLLDTEPGAALKRFQSAIELHSKSASAWKGRGTALYSLERYPAALIAYDRAIQLNPKSEQAWKGRGDTLFRLERFEAALTSYNKSLQIQPNNADSLNRKGRALYKLERYQEALSAQNAALKAKPNYARALSDRGIVLIGLGQYQEAVESFDQAQGIEPLNPEFWQNKALAWQYLGKNQEAFRLYQEALQAYDTLLQDDPRNVTALIDKGNVLTKLQQHEKALIAYELAIANNPDSHLAWLNKGNVLFALQQYQRALEAFDRALKLNPESYITQHNRGSLLRDGLKDYPEAIASYDKSIDLNPIFYHAWRDRGFALSQSGQQYLALESFKTALEIKPNDYKSWIGRGIALSSLNEMNQAIAAFDKAESIQPKDPFVLINKASALEKTGQRQKACVTYKKVTTLNPSFTPAISALERLGCEQ
ncbi:tetratricopeptide repeat protein,protein kinase family protein [Xenococcus sp. PCC 7305]|uniref:tetratricopeptide repeat protein n=1 Tax=Xenococcus sp. PCC 7305 TaxID=102125 RepID=UPI0002AC58EB|nr:tetratricopeptide repeat protein [Xenococcus sp. PCC 7305]ELS01986.1 tetratricopeptide repeat protein,protein kinase family protein [Xenococcus sp. PCC 7305]